MTTNIPLNRICIELKKQRIKIETIMTALETVPDNDTVFGSVWILEDVGNQLNLIYDSLNTGNVKITRETTP